MVFSSLQFLFLFMPIFFTIYYVVPKPYKNFVLLLGSLSFYLVGAWHHIEHFALLLISILFDFWIGLFIEKYPKHKKWLLSLGVGFHLLSLIFFKYFGFLLTEWNRFFTTSYSLNIVLPIGISFYTFQGLSYLFDVYAGKIKAEKSLLRFSVYISMFEQLIAGPIVTYAQIQKELYARKITKQMVFRGVQIFIFGLGMKVLLANPLGKVFTQAKNIGFESISTPFAWLSILAFTLQIYFDFFGYSLMAIGLGKMLGFTIPRNFYFPYSSCSMTEFWRRWHISLGNWFREYVYIPLGGNRHGTARTILNLCIVWILTGIWHGAGYNFLLWGFSLFLILVIEKFFLQKYLQRYRFFGHIYMMLLIPLTWAVFAIEDISQLGIFFLRLFPFGKIGFFGIFPGDAYKYLSQYWPFFLIGLLLCMQWPYQLFKKINNKYVLNGLLLCMFCASVYCMYKGFDDPFLYFRF